MQQAAGPRHTGRLTESKGIGAVERPDPHSNRAMTAPRPWRAVAAASLVGAALLPLVAEGRPIGEWRISHEIEGYGAGSAFVCLVQKKGLFGRSWRAEREADAGPDCVELIAFDPASETIYLAFPGALATAEYICSKGLSIEGRHPCKSDFFSKEGSEPNRRRLDRESLRDALDDAKAFALAEQVMAEGRAQQAREAQARHAECHTQLERASNLAALDRALSACDAVIDEPTRAAAAMRRGELMAAAREAALREYRGAHAALGREASIEALDRFIARYQGDDPDQLVPHARALREERLARLQLLQEERELQRRVAELIDRMEGCRRQIQGARDLRARELKVTALSGVRDDMKLRRAAEIEVECQSRIDTWHREYRALGGTGAREDFE